MRISYLIKKTATFRMLCLCLTLLISVILTNQSYAQLTGVKTIPGTYPTLVAAVADLNVQGVGAGGVTFDIAAGYTETLGATLSLTATGTAANPIVFQKSGVGANPLITAYTGGTSTPASVTGLDGIMRLVGSDWVTIDGISLQENPANTGNARMEYGLAFYKVNGTNGCNNNTIKNCVISLDRNNITNGVTETEIGSCGIFAANATFSAPTVALIVTSVNGTNSNNKFYSNTIQNCNVGISMRGFADAVAPFVYYDQATDIGGNSPATANSIINYGGGIANVGATAAAGIKVANVNAANISNNIVSSTGGAGAHLGEVKGILNTSPNGALATFNNNTVSTRSGTFNGFITNQAIDCQVGSLPSAAVIQMTNNIITNCVIDSGLNIGNNSPGLGIRVGSSPTTVNITGNLIYGDTMYNVGTFTGINYAGSNLSADVNITNNQIYDIYRYNGNANTFGGNQLIGITSSSGKLNIANNQIHDLTMVRVNNGLNCTIHGINMASPSNVTTTTIANNNVYNLSISGNSTASNTGVINGINFGGNTGTQALNLTISGNTFYNFTLNLPGATTSIIRGMEVSCGININVFNNKMYDFTGNGLGYTVMGMRLLAGINMNIYNNYMGNFYTPSATAASAPEQVIGILDESAAATAGQNRNIYYNTIYLSGTSSGTNFGSSAIKTSVNPNTTLRNNLFINNTIPQGLGLAVAHRRASTSLTTYMAASNNNIYYAGTPGATRLIYFDGTNSDQTLTAYKTRVAGRDNASATELTPFLSTVGSNPNFLHVNTGIATAAESGGANISGITTDFDADIRQGNGGYIGTGTAPDIGADEFGGIANDLVAPAISAGTVLGACGTGDRTISGVVITDATGVPTTGTLVPRIYYKKNVGGSYFSQPGTLTSGTATNGTWDFTIIAADMGGLTTTDSVGYYFIAQDTVVTPNISSVPFGVVATDVNTVSVHPATVNYYKVLKSLSGTYLVGAGQVSPNYATITAAIADYNASCLSGPVTFSLVDASYLPTPLPMTINANPYASATNTLTIKPASGNVSIQGSGVCILALLGADYVTIEGSASPVANSVCPLVQSTRNLSITNTNTATSQNGVIFIASNGFDGATNNVIRNCNIIGNSNTTTNVGIMMGAGPVATGISTATNSLGYTNNNNIIENNSVVKVQHGIVSQGFSYAVKNQNNIYRLNDMTTATPNCVGRIGILIGFENNALVTGNSIKNIVGAASGAAVMGISAGSTNSIGATFNGTNEITNSVISNNVIDNLRSFGTIASQSLAGIALGGSPSGVSSSGTNLIANNMISHCTANGSGANLTSGIFIGSQLGSTTQVYNNTVFMNARVFTTSANPTLALFALGNPAISSLDIRNNILVNTGSVGTGNNFVVGFQSPGNAGNYANLVSDNNDLFVSNDGGGVYNAIGVVGTGSTPSIIPGFNNYPTLAAWQAQTGKDANSKNVLPAFVNANNPHLVNNSAANFPLNGTAVTFGSVPADIDCESRTGVSSPDIGADEFTLPPIDIAFDAIKPTANTTCHSANEPIIVTVRNTGSTTIDMSVDTIFVSTTYSGTISGTSVDTIYTGTLAPNATVDVTLDPTINTTVNGSYTFTTAITPIAGESSSTNNNNVTTININSTPLSVATSVFSDSLCLGFSTAMTASSTGGTLPYTYSWSDGLGTSSSVTAAPAVQTTYTVTVTDGCGNTATATAFVDVFIPGVQSVNPGSRCGVGSVALSAVPNPGSSLLWYNSATGTTVAGSGNTYNTPSISSTTNFYVSATSGNIPYYAGLTDLSPVNGPVTFGNGATRNGLAITATKPGAITGCTVYPSFIAPTHVIRVCLRARGSAVNIATAGPFTFSTGTIGAPVKLNFNIPITTPGDYQLTYDTVTGSSIPTQIGLGQISFAYLGSYPLTNADGSFIIVGGSFGNNLAPVSGSYSSFWNVEYTTYCESARVPVLATVTPPPALTVSANVNLCLGDTFPITVNSDTLDFDTFVWTPATNLFVDSLCTVAYTPGSSATKVYVTLAAAGSQVYTLTATDTVTLCANAATCTVTAQPAITGITANTYGICGSGSAILSFTPATGFGVGGFVWESSADSLVWNPVAGTTSTITTPVLSSSTYFRVRSLSSNNEVCSELGFNKINVYSSYIDSTIADTTCGLGSVNLSVVVSPGATGAWYSTPTAVVPLFVGTTFTTPAIATSTTYYVASQEGFSTNAVGIPTATTNFGTLGTSTVNTLWLTVVKPGLLQTVTMYPTAAGTFSITLNLRGSATPLISVGPFTITSGQVGTAVNIPVNMPMNTPGVYQLCFAGLSFTQIQSYNGSASGYPFTNADGSLILNGTANNATSTAALGNVYAPFFNIQYNTVCESARVPVLATVLPVPAFTTNITIDTVCGQTPKLLSVTSPITNFSTYIWTPDAGLYLDAAGTIPYVAGSSEDTVYANPTATTIYTVTATDTVLSCVATQTISITPIYLTPSLATNANLTEVCGTGSVILNVTGIFNSNLATYQWESSIDSLVWNPVIGGTGTTLLTDVLTQDIYFRCAVNCTGSPIGNSPALKIFVRNPLILTTTADTVCGSGSPTLQATASGGATINWFDAPTGGYMIGTGNSFTTPVITATTNYYVEANNGTYNEPVGIATPATGGGVSLFPGRGLRFTATKQLTINSVTVANNDQGSATGFMDIALQDNTGAEITSTGIISGLGFGVHVIPLNFVVPVGTDYRLVVKSGGAGFFAQSNPVTYPMNSFSGAMSITAGLSQAGVSTANVYYLFYGINITASCYSPRVPVEAFVKTTVPVSISASATTVCSGSPVTLVASSTYDPNYSYFWVNDNISGATAVVSPATSTIYTVVATDISGGPNNGCQTIKTVAISVIPAIPAFTISPASTPLCKGSSVGLSVVMPPLGGNAVFGTDTLLANQPTNYPAPYGELYESAKHQILIRASELTAQGLTAGSEVNTLAFNVQSVGTAGIMNGFSIQIAPTSATALTAWTTTGFTNVFGPINYQPVVGANVHNFSSAFVWDGTSNIIVQTCFSNDPTGISNSGTANAVMHRSLTAFNSVIYTNFNDVDVCPLTPSFVLSANRPNIVLGYDRSVSYSWSPATGLNNSTSASVNASPLTSTIYTVTVTSTLFGCSATSTSEVNVSEVLYPYLQEGDSILCSNDLGFDMHLLDSGTYSGGYPAGTTIDFYGAGGVLYQTGSSTTFFNQNNSDAFYAVVTLPAFLGSCSATSDTSVIDFGTAQAPQYILNTDSVKCFGGATGNAIVDITFGGTPNFRYQWYDSGMTNLLRDVTKSATNDSLQNVPAGMYIVVITDHQGATVSPYCSVTDSVYVGEPLAPLAVSENVLSHIDLVCNGATNGALGIDVSDGTPGYSYNWSNGSTDEDLTGIGAGTYTVIVTDSRGCTATLVLVVTEPTAVVPSCSATPVSCNGGSDGSATVTAVGGTPGYTYLWSTAAVSSSISGLTAGIYTVTVTDANGCSVTCTSEVTEPTVVTANCNATPVSCNGTSTGTVSVTAGGGTPGYTYLWSTNAATSTISGVAAGTYTVTVTDANGCSTTCSTEVSEPTTVMINCSATPVSCNGGTNGTASVTANGGTPAYTYLWSTSAATSSINGLAAGIYTVTVTDANGCSTTCTSEVTEPTILSVTENTGNHTDIVCFGDASGTLGVNVIGGTSPYAYLWSNGYTVDNNQTGLVAGTYTVTVTDANGCSSSISMTLTTNPLVTPTIIGNVFTCGGSTTLTTQAYASYLWSNGATTQSTIVTALGTYTVTVTNSLGCTGTATIVVTSSINTPAKPSTMTGSFIGNCNKLNMTYSCPPVAGALSYTWTVPVGVKIISGQGTNSIVVNYTPAYTASSGIITVSAVNLCGSSPALKRYTSSRLTTPVISGSNTMCPGDIKTYTVAPVAGALSYTWTKVTGSTILSGQGTNTVTIKWGSVGGIIKCTANNACGGSVPANFGVSLTCAKLQASKFDFSELSLYPNPASTSATLQFNGFDNGKALLQVFDIVGQMVITQDLNVTLGQNQYQLDLATLPKGIYSIRVVYHGMIRNEKLIVQ